MKIESIKPGKRDKDKLVIRTECGSYISARIDDAYKLRVGDEISCEEASELERAYNAEAVKRSAARSLSHHSMSRYDLEKKLKSRGYSEAESSSAADWFEEKGMLDDASYARAAAEYYKNRGYGDLRIREELKRRGIERDMIEEVLDELPPSDDEISSLIRKKLRGEIMDADKRRKLVAFLLRRGFKFDEIKRAMNDMEIDTEGMED